MKVRVYIDGYNLFYGVLKARFSSNIPIEYQQRLKQEKRKLRWLNVEKLVQQFLKDDYIIDRINFYTADINGFYNGDKAPANQREYYKALETISNLKIYKGHFYTHTIELPKAPISYPLQKVSVIKTEEKGSDVNLASHLVFDACQNLFDMAVVVTNDSDLLEPIKIVKGLNKRILILCPHKKYCYEFLQSFGIHCMRNIDNTHLRKAQFPDILLDYKGQKIAQRPHKWK